MNITIEHIKKSYSGTPVLNIGGATIRSGELVELTGQNGSGKTTLMTILAGLDKQFTGRVLYDGRPLDHAMAQKITLVAQKPLLLNRSVFENVEYPLKVRKWEERRRKETVSALLEAFQISHLRKRNATHLSGGETQKVALARALSFEPSALFLDEPLSAIDTESLPMMEEIVRTYQERTAATVLFVSHSASPLTIGSAKILLKKERTGSVCEFL